MNKNIVESVAVIGTLAKAGLALPLYDSILNRDLSMAATAAGAYALLDHLDGHLARKFHADNVARRLTDSVLDASMIAGVFTVVAATQPSNLNYILPVLAAWAPGLVSNSMSYAKENTVITGGAIHKLGSVSAATLGLTLLSDNEPIKKFMCVAAGTTFGVLSINYIGGRSANKSSKIPIIPKVKKIRKLDGFKWLLNKNNRAELEVFAR